MTDRCVATPVFVNCRDRVTSLSALVSWLERAGHVHIVLVDNASTYPPLLEYYAQTPHKVVKLGRNLGPGAIWKADLLESVPSRSGYVLTDSDVVPDENAPYDAVDRFADLLNRHQDVDKVGFGLRIDDLPDCYRFKREVVDWELQFWEDEVERGVFRADLDTTFALYRPQIRTSTLSALRTGSPYVARHVPWYMDSASPSEEEAYYRQHASLEMTNWNGESLPSELSDAIEYHRSKRSDVSRRPS